MRTDSPPKFKSLGAVQLLCLLLLLAPQLQADDRERAIGVERIQAANPRAFVQINVDRPDRTYRIGQKVTVQVKASCAGFLHLIYVHPGEKPVLLYPNKYQREHRIDAGKTYQVPGEWAGFAFPVKAPVGVGVLKAIITKTKLKSINLKRLDKDVLLELSDKDVKAIGVEATSRQTRLLAEHQILVKTIAADERSATSKAQRVGIFIGISRYIDERLSNLVVCHRDAQLMADVMKEQCGLDKVYVLTDEQATLKNIRATLHRVANHAKPDDEVVIFWSGHGGRIADTSGEEKDGYDEVLLTNDSNISTIESIRKTTLSDDLFGRWIQDFSMCRVLVILDTCHSGGQANNEKGLNLPGFTPKEDSAFDFWDGEFNALTKDIGQQVTVLCSSRANQISFVRKQKDMSVMVYYIHQLISNGEQHSITVQDLYKYVSKEVPAYVKRVYGVKQTPVLIGDAEQEFSIRR